MSAKQKTMELLAEAGGQLIRDGKHAVYVLPNGGVVTIPKTPSDYRAWENAYHTVRRVTGRAPIKLDLPTPPPKSKTFGPRPKKSELPFNFSRPSTPGRDLASQLGRFFSRQRSTAG
jgi:hypothetical protein